LTDIANAVISALVFLGSIYVASQNMLDCAIRMAKSSQGHNKKPVIGVAQKHTLRSQRSRKAPKPIIKKPAIGGADKIKSTPVTLMDKYSQRAQKWTLHFRSHQIVRSALADIVKLNKSTPFLMPGTCPTVIGEATAIQLVWKTHVNGRSLYNFFWKHSPTVGPMGRSRPTNFQPTFQFVSASNSPMSTGLDASAAAIGAAKEEAGSSDGGYPPLPEEFAAASFDGQSMKWDDYETMKRALAEHGFIILPGYIPGYITKQALEEATTYFLGVLKSFQFGFSIDKGMAGFDDLAKLPNEVWERQPKKQKVMTFVALWHGMKVGPSLQSKTQLEVVEVIQGGQASRLGVKLGWVVVKVNGKKSTTGTTFGGKPLADFINGGGVFKGTEICFQPPTHFSPLAVSQKWGVFTSNGYQKGLGLGKSTDSIWFADSPAVMNAQLWMRSLMASLHECLPTDLCWQPDGVSFKAGRDPVELYVRTDITECRLCRRPPKPDFRICGFFDSLVHSQSGLLCGAALPGLELVLATAKSMSGSIDVCTYMYDLLGGEGPAKFRPVLFGSGYVHL